MIDTTKLIMLAIPLINWVQKFAPVHWTNNRKLQGDLSCIFSGIYPDYDLYKVDDIKSAIREVLGLTPAIRCSKGPFGKFQLYEVYFCVDKTGSTLIECPVYPKFTCSDKILFHPYRSWMLNETASVAAESYISVI